MLFLSPHVLIGDWYHNATYVDTVLYDPNTSCSVPYIRCFGHVDWYVQKCDVLFPNFYSVSTREEDIRSSVIHAMKQKFEIFKDKKPLREWALALQKETSLLNSCSTYYSDENIKGNNRSNNNVTRSLVLLRLKLLAYDWAAKREREVNS